MKRKTILVIDDDELFVETVTAVLESDYTVRRASNGKEALKSVEERRPDLIILDVMMDYMSEGFDVAHALRTNPETASIPIIMLTGVDQVYDYRVEVDESWIPWDRYFEKPIAPDRLLAEVRALID